MERKIYPLKTHALGRELLDRHYREAKEARDTGRKVVWCSGSAPTDLLVAMDMLPLYPENHAAMCAARGGSTELCQVAEAGDYSPDLCGYARNDLGSVFSGGKKSPVGGLPPPDLILISTMCNTHVKWFEELSRIFKVPIRVLDTPFVHHGLAKEDMDRIIKYVRDQIVELMDFLSDFSGRPFDHDRFQEAVGLTGQAARLYGETLVMAKHRPSPITAFDTFLHLGPLMDLRGFPEAVDYYRKLKEEVEQRKSQNLSAIGEELYRLYWDNIPIWFRVGHLGRKLAAYGANCAVALYPFTWVEAYGPQDAERPIDSVAEAQPLLALNQGTRFRLDLLTRFVEEYAIDGLVVHMSRTCKVYLADQYGLIKEVERRTGVPGVIIEGDMADTRLYSDAEADSRIEAFMAVLEGRARSKA